MKKILLILGGILILFLLAFCCSYTIYQKTDSFSDDSYAVETIIGKGRSGKRQEIQNDSISEEKTSTEKTSTEKTSAEETTTGERSLSEDASTQMAATDSYRFLVNELNGYVAVFTANGSLYEFTDIRIKDLDNILKNRIINGIKFQKEKELFTFLESCSS